MPHRSADDIVADRRAMLVQLQRPMGRLETVHLETRIQLLRAEQQRLVSHALRDGVFPPPPFPDDGP